MSLAKKVGQRPVLSVGLPMVVIYMATVWLLAPFLAYHPMDWDLRESIAGFFSLVLVLLFVAWTAYVACVRGRAGLGAARILLSLLWLVPCLVMNLVVACVVLASLVDDRATPRLREALACYGLGMPIMLALAQFLAVGVGKLIVRFNVRRGAWETTVPIGPPSSWGTPEKRSRPLKRAGDEKRE